MLQVGCQFEDSNSDNMNIEGELELSKLYIVTPSRSEPPVDLKISKFSNAGPVYIPSFQMFETNTCEKVCGSFHLHESFLVLEKSISSVSSIIGISKRGLYKILQTCNQDLNREYILGYLILDFPTYEDVEKGPQADIRQRYRLWQHEA